ncbi:glycosyltransferase family 2 protein [Marinimicrobium sp. ARAG 43.8]|uniref:glycosyltransferase family 2 protein n=1 Tax=Marinimicrobium sp. ARAG 43.8 TaxID=3418719 RepID=UPI003CEC90F2
MSSDPQHSAYEVLVCTYNGERYIADQLESILKQQPAPAGVLVSDDGSTDQTRTIVKQIAASSSISVALIDGPGKGVIQNVLTALPKTTAPYVFLADQDDIWLDNKASLFYEKMRTDDAPHLIFSDAWVWHPESNEKTSFWKLDQLNPRNASDPRRLAFHNTVQGASACVNRALIMAMQNTACHSDIVMHDWWLALIASGTGLIEPIAEPTLLYRQHNDNQVGAREQLGGKQRNPLLRKFKTSLASIRQAVAFANQFEGQLKTEYRPFFNALSHSLTKGPHRRFWFILKFFPRKRNCFITLALWGMIMAQRVDTPPL